MEKSKTFSTVLPYGSMVNPEKTDVEEILNEELVRWGKMKKPGNYRILNVVIEEITNRKLTIYSMFVAYK